MPQHINRRQFVATTLATGTAAAALSAGRSASAPPVQQKTRPPLCVFSKYLQFLDYKKLAATCREIGLDGIDLTVREGGHVLPKNVGRDLPAAVEAARAEGIDVSMISTTLLSGDDPDARPILKTASKLGIRYFRISGHQYDHDGEVLPQIARFTEEVRSLVRIGEEFNMIAGFHNHSGMYNFGAPVWDLHRMYEAIGSPNLGANFDIGHAMVEGGFGDWQITARLIAPHTKMMAVKDFVWVKNEPKWVPLGEGIVPTAAFFKIMRAAGFAGPISMHFEYKVASNDALIAEVRKAAVTLRAALAEAGYS